MVVGSTAQQHATQCVMTVVVVVTSFSTSMEQACITSTTSTNLAAWNLLFFPPTDLHTVDNKNGIFMQLLKNLWKGSKWGVQLCEMFEKILN